MNSLREEQKIVKNSENSQNQSKPVKNSEKEVKVLLV